MLHVIRLYTHLCLESSKKLNFVFVIHFYFSMAAFINLVFFCSVKTHDYSIIFEYLRFTYLQLVNDKNLDEHKRKIKIRSIVTAMNYSFCHFQCVAQQRFISRLLIKNPDEMHFHIIAGNNSLMSGSYKNAICKFYFFLFPYS